jgi:hypothetical protein
MKHLKFSSSLLALFAILAAGLVNSAPARATSLVQTQTLSFNNASMVGALALPGSSFNYSNVAPGVDAKVTYVSTNLAANKIDLNWIDQVSAAADLRPSLDFKYENIKLTNTQPSDLLVGYNVKLRIDFFAAGSTTPIALKGFSALVRDIDIKQGAAFAGATTVLTATGSPLAITRTADGIRVNETAGLGSGVDDKPYWAEWKFDSPVSTIGATLFSGTSGGNAYWLEFKSAAWGATSVTGTYEAPSAVNDSYTTPFNTAVSGVAGTGDSYPAGSVFAQTSQPANGSVVWNNDGTYTYTPTAGFSGADSFTYEITTPDGQKVSATQLITVQAAVATPTPTPAPTQAAVAPPIAVNDNYSTAFNTPVSGAAGTGDTFAVGSVFAQTSQPANGSVVWNADGTYTYTPNTGFSGVDSFTYEVTAPDGQKSSATQFITIQAAVVTPAPAPTLAPVQPVTPVVPVRKPIAAPDYKSGKQNQDITFVPVGNDTPGDVELLPTSIALCGSACELLTPGSPDHASLQAKPVVTEQGTWKIDLASGNVIFTPAKNWFGTASIEYIMFDAAGNQVKSMLSIDIPNEIVEPVEEELAYTGVDELPATIAVSIALIALGLVLRRRFSQN